MKLAARRSLIGTLTFSTLAPAALILGATFGLEHCGGSGTADVGDASPDGATNADASGSDSSVDARVDARTDGATTTDSGADAARESGSGLGDGGGDGSRDGSGDGRADTGTDARADSGTDSGVTQDSGTDASTTTDSGADATTDGSTAQDAAADSGNGFQVVQTCLEGLYADRTANNATREVPWGFSLGAASERCIKIKAGQTVDWVLENPQASFGVHPLEVPSSGAGTTPNPISQASGAGNVRSATFPNAGVFGYVCGNGHQGMLGAVWVVPD